MENTHILSIDREFYIFDLLSQFFSQKPRKKNVKLLIEIIEKLDIHYDLKHIPIGIKTLFVQDDFITDLNLLYDHLFVIPSSCNTSLSESAYFYGYRNKLHLNKELEFLKINVQTDSVRDPDHLSNEFLVFALLLSNYKNEKDTAKRTEIRTHTKKFGKNHLLKFLKNLSQNLQQCDCIQIENFYYQLVEFAKILVTIYMREYLNKNS